MKGMGWTNLLQTKTTGESPMPDLQNAFTVYIYILIFVWPIHNNILIEAAVIPETCLKLKTHYTQPLLVITDIDARTIRKLISRAIVQ